MNQDVQANEGAPALALVHTAPALVETFNALLADLAPDIPVRHVLHDELLSEALEAGELTADIRRRTAEAVLAEAGPGTRVVLCTCSTVGPGADDAASATAVPVLRVDRPMAEEAVRIGRRIAVTATLSTTIPPTMDLLAEAARDAGREVELVPIVFEAARAKFIEGDAEGYLRVIVGGLQDAANEVDVIVLAQASMAPALAECGDIDIPIMTSPRSGLEAAIATYRKVAAPS
jgi:hypothetical protein